MPDADPPPEHDERLPVWARRLRATRTALGFSQDALAERAGVGQETISAIERGGNTTTDTLLKLSRALDVDLVHLFLPYRLPAGIPPDQIEVIAATMAEACLLLREDVTHFFARVLQVGDRIVRERSRPSNGRKK